MNARIVLVHDDLLVVQEIADALRGVGHSVAATTDSLLAIGVLDTDRPIDLLVTRVFFLAGRPTGRPHGVTLARMAKQREPEAKVLFVALPWKQRLIGALGEFLPMPVAATDVVQAVNQILSAHS
ncbi:MAG TPA: hypothetical protein VFH59_03245 [Frateuria sp.]|uniref:hypothetical protein n=1 Tax=Frateuria sp. TaxID=2211372 RepID=UPI002D809923|nr:hypothetical protein [Frateuria sp.]HET6804442.1 hypothetical protein [Frateuria sp.]